MDFIKEPSVAIILVNWNGYELTKVCIHSLFRMGYQNYHVVLVDNASPDGSGPRIRDAFKDKITYIQNEKNLGFSGGNNTGIRYALEKGFDYILELNNDTEVEPDFLTRLVDSIDDRPEFGAAQPVMTYTSEKEKVWNAGGIYWPVLGLSFTRNKNRPVYQAMNSKETDWITGCCFLIKTEVLQKVGFLKEVFFFGSFEDVDMSLRIKQEGYKLWYECTSKIYHSVGQSSKSKTKGKEGYLNPMLHYLVNRNQLFFIRMHVKWWFLPLAYAVQAGKMLAFTLYFIVRGRFGKLRHAWRGFFHGIIKNYEDR
ncbi:glycosyltransferase family 2 protein [Echinicola rosea]|uniref:Glycosyl transferase n=1 Tax=Echinicola rosea TaxID=1807691 RepID=A0ABQ1UW48_9BACT|nr:glycosyltransferase family 2 protein [Echinicola rosea]GGF27634.1 glycosyl transferase [Echinicola rosea]